MLICMCDLSTANTLCLQLLMVAWSMTPKHSPLHPSTPPPPPAYQSLSVLPLPPTRSHSQHGRYDHVCRN